MREHGSLEQALKFIEVRLQEVAGGGGPQGRRPGPVVTLSRQSGTGGIEFGERLARALEREACGGEPPWTVFHKNLVEKVLEEHHLPRRWAQYMPEDRVSAIADAVEELLGLHPAAGLLVRQTTETILHLSELGHVILVGRAANIVTARHPRAAHFRLVGRLARRARRVAEERGIAIKVAEGFVEAEDAARRRYVKAYFHRDIDDPLIYDAVLNMDTLSLDDAIAMVLPVVRQRAGRVVLATTAVPPL